MLNQDWNVARKDVRPRMMPMLIVFGYAAFTIVDNTIYDYEWQWFTIYREMKLLLENCYRVTSTDVNNTHMAVGVYLSGPCCCPLSAHPIVMGSAWRAWHLVQFPGGTTPLTLNSALAC